MKLLRESFNMLKEEGFFDANVNISISLDNKIHQRLIESFVCSDGVYKKFLSSYMNLTYNFNNSEEFKVSLYNAYRQLVVSPSLYSSDLQAHHLQAIYLLILSVFCSNGKLDLGVGSRKSYIVDLCNVLNDPNLSIAKTGEKALKVLSKNNTRTGNIAWTRLIQVTCWLQGMLADIAYPNVVLEESYDERLKQSDDTFIKGIDLSVRGNNHLNKSSYEFLSRRIIWDMEDFRVDLNIERNGFLKEEERSGVLDLSSKGESNVVTSLLFNYTITECVTDEGLAIHYFIYSTDFKVHVVEDFITNKVVCNMFFMDSAYNENTDENMTRVIIGLYKMVRDRYVETLSNKEKTTNKVKVYTVDRASNLTDDGEYFYQYIIIAPYKRRTPSGKQASPEKIKEAKKFGFVLKDGETFVNKFPRAQRYKNNNKDEE